MTDRMKDVDQTDPYMNSTFGTAVYRRGPVADGGREQAEETMEDVEHESPVEGTRRTFERGAEDDE